MDGSALFATAWVHVFEEDGPEGAVYRPDGTDVRRSRRPRERLSLAPDGQAWLVVPGPDDRLHELEARWRETGGEITVTTDPAAAPARTLRVRLLSSDRLLVRR
jgi:hypothetical protein